MTSTTRAEAPRADGGPAAPGRLPGILLGVGLGAFVDGIVIHQLLQWHHMRTGDGAAGGESMTTVGGLEANTLADGLFHALAWLVVVVGVYMLWQRGRGDRGLGSWARLSGLLLLGWGLFNLVEGVVDHHVLRIHHVRDDLGGPLGWDLGFLAVAVAQIAIGRLIVRAADRSAAAATPPV